MPRRKFTRPPLSWGIGRFADKLEHFFATERPSGLVATKAQAEVPSPAMKASPPPKFRLRISRQTADKLLGEVCTAGILREPPLIGGIGRIEGEHEHFLLQSSRPRGQQHQHTPECLCHVCRK